jgi:hypothetical protein
MRCPYLLRTVTAYCLLLLSATAYCQRPTDTLAWLGSENAAGLHALPDLRLSTVETYVATHKGGFVNYYESDNSMEAGAATESYYRLNRRVVFYGKVHYSYFTGRNMGGSAWIDPYYSPFDLVEAADTTHGTKNLERYRLTGALSVNLWRGLSLGGRIDYQAANYAKTRDLRHINNYSDLSFTAGANYVFGAVELGLNYYYRYSAEGITFNIYGNTDRQYTTLISFGSFFGRTELFGEDGYTGDANPLFNTYHGAAAQAGLRVNPQWSLFVEAAGKVRSGQFGRRSTSTPIYTEHEGTEFSVKGTLSYRRHAAHHLLNATFGREQLKNFENIYREETSAGGRSEVVYYAQTIARDATRRQAGISYTGYLGLAGNRPAWRLEAGADYAQQRQTVTQYPYYRQHYIYRVDLFLSAGRTVEWKTHDFGLDVGAMYGAGGGDPKNDGVYSPPSSTQKPPKAFDSYLYHEFDYLTAARAGGHVEGTYGRRFRHGFRMSATLRYALLHALQPVQTPESANHFVSLTLRLEL